MELAEAVAITGIDPKNKTPRFRSCRDPEAAAVLEAHRNEAIRRTRSILSTQYPSASQFEIDLMLPQAISVDPKTGIIRSPY